MQKSGFDLSDLHRFVDSIPEKVRQVCDRVGQEAVEYAKANGSYRDVTGRLRRSNKYRATAEGLEVYNDAPYASEVEARGHEVTQGATLLADKLLNEA